MANGYGDNHPSHYLARTNDTYQLQQEDDNRWPRIASPGNDRSSTIVNPYYTGSPRPAMTFGLRGSTIDRQEIIKRIKSGGSRPSSPEIERSGSRGSDGRRRSPVYGSSVVSSLDAQTIPMATAAQHEAAGLQIERPRSALHRGDFRENDPAAQPTGAFPATSDSSASPLSTSPVAPWHPHFPSTALRFREELRPAQTTSVPALLTPRARATSTVHVSGFIYKPPTSPLVQSSRPDTPEPGRSRSPDKARRHTFSPPSLHRAIPDRPNFESAFSHDSPTVPTLQTSRTFPYQAHQPRRSLNMNSLSTIMNPQTNSRRPSLSDSPLHHAPMVGSYEESILRGRMSTTPSKPLNFVAQIGVLGKGDCKPSLRCPPHASVAFPAVFYSYGPGSRLLSSNDQPSPYVGLIDLENNVNSMQSNDSRQHRLTRSSPLGSRASSRTRNADHIASDSHAHLRRRHKQKRRSCSPKAPSGGSYRIPQQGQLQIVIKTPNKTAVKLFLVPYDLSDMEPGQKTFIRQRSYSAGPIIDMPLSQRKNLGTDRPEASLSASEDPNDRPVLRYLIHLNICCTSKGRFFLYKSIRVVFANRVPDGKEKLRNEIQLPEPRYSSYKPGRASIGHVGNGLSTSRATSRRTSVVQATQGSPDESPWSTFPSPVAQSCPPDVYQSRYGNGVVNHAFSTLSPTQESRPSSRHTEDPMIIDSPSSRFLESPQSPLSTHQHDTVVLSRTRQLQDPFTFDRESSRERGPQRNESLLARRLMDLAFQGQSLGQNSGKAAHSDSNQGT